MTIDKKPAEIDPESVKDLQERFRKSKAKAEAEAPPSAPPEGCTCQWHAIDPGCYTRISPDLNCPIHRDHPLLAVDNPEEEVEEAPSAVEEAPEPVIDEVVEPQPTNDPWASARQGQ